MRLDKYICTLPGTTRSEARKFIQRGRVKVNGETVKKNDFNVDSVNDEVLLNGEKVIYSEYVYIIMNKAKGLISATDDKRQATVISVLPEALKYNNLAPVGRLDKDTTGLLIITNDGAFAHEVISPKKHIVKKYYVELDGVVTKEAEDGFREGVTLADGTKCLKADIEKITDTSVYVWIYEGKYHQVKRMFGVYDLGVNELKRVSIGALELPADLEEGEARLMSEEEKRAIFE